MSKPKSFDSWTEQKKADRRAKKKQSNAKWRAKNPEKDKHRSAKWRAENPEKVKQCQAKWYAENKQNLAAIKFFQMAQVVSEIANINTK